MTSHFFTFALGAATIYMLHIGTYQAQPIITDQDITDAAIERFILVIDETDKFVPDYMPRLANPPIPPEPPACKTSTLGCEIDWIISKL